MLTCDVVLRHLIMQATTISDFKAVLDGKYDDLPEAAFYMVGDIKEVQQKAKQLVENA